MYRSEHIRLACFEAKTAAPHLEDSTVLSSGAGVKKLASYASAEKR